MKKLITMGLLIASLLAPKLAMAETVETCTSTTNGYGSGSVCGAYTEKEHVVIVETGIGDSLPLKIMLGFALAAGVATGLYKLTYKLYILD